MGRGRHGFVQIKYKSMKTDTKTSLIDLAEAYRIDPYREMDIYELISLLLKAIADEIY